MTTHQRLWTNLLVVAAGSVLLGSIIAYGGVASADSDALLPVQRHGCRVESRPVLGGWPRRRAPSCQVQGSAADHAK